MASTTGSAQSSSERSQSRSASQGQPRQPQPAYASDASSGQRQHKRGLSGQQKGTRRSRKAPKGPVRRWLIPTVSLLLWMLVSSAVILLNKQILVEDGFTYPLTLSALGQFASAIAGESFLMGNPGMPATPATHRGLHRIRLVKICSGHRAHEPQEKLKRKPATFTRILRQHARPQNGKSLGRAAPSHFCRPSRALHASMPCC